MAGEIIVQVEQSGVIGPLATLFAAFFGAGCAFLFQNHREKNENRRQNVSAGNRALATLFQQTNTLKLYQIDWINLYRDSPGRHIQMQPVLPYDEGSLTFDIKSLDFLMKAESAMVVFDLILEEERYREAIKAINTRSNHHYMTVQPKLEKAGINEGQEYPDHEFRKALGELDYMHLKRLTDSVIEHVDKTIVSLADAKERFRKALINKYPNELFVDFQF